MPDTFTIEDLRRKLQERQHKMTPQRKEVLQIFLDHPGEHLSAEDVHDILREKKSDIGLATVYRSLELLSDLGILLKLKLDDRFCSYEINTTDPTMHRHHHLICMKCDKIIEFEDDLLDDLEQKIESQMGFHVLNHEVKFFGYCKECREHLED